MNYINQITRPNLYKLTERELLDIIISIDKSWFGTDNQIYTRSELVDKIFELWSKNEIVDNFNKPIECLICCESLTNGNNLTFECGHKFHSYCIIKHILVFSTNTYIDYINDNDKKSTKIEYCCPQCKLSIDCVSFIKNENN